MDTIDSDPDLVVALGVGTLKKLNLERKISIVLRHDQPIQSVFKGRSHPVTGYRSTRFNVQLALVLLVRIEGGKER